MLFILEIMARSQNSRCNFENGFFSCDLPEDAGTSSGKDQDQNW